MAWKTLDGKEIPDIYEEIRTVHEKMEQSNGFLLAFIATDSQNIGQRFTSFVQCVALHMFDENGIGHGGRVYYIRHQESRYQSMQKKLLREAEISIKLGQKMEPLFEELGIPFEVHADVNSYAGDKNQNKSHDVHDAVKGWVESMGWFCSTKPLAFVASIVADRHVRGTKKSRKFPSKKRKEVK